MRERLGKKFYKACCRKHGEWHIRDKFTECLIKAWDPDFTKVTPEEAKRIAEAEKSGFIDEADIDWDHLSEIAL